MIFYIGQAHILAVFEYALKLIINRKRAAYVKDYIKLAKAKGVPNAMIWLRHVFRNSVTPMVNLIPGSVLMTISGSIYVESLYSIPGMGGLLVDVIKRQDNTMVQALVIIYSVIGILGLILGDMLMALVDPRISFVKKEGSR